jgi:hypothetical protein
MNEKIFKVIGDPASDFQVIKTHMPIQSEKKIV